MSQHDRHAVFNKAMGFMNDVYSSPNSVNFDRIRTNSQINPALRADAKKLFEDPLWVDWFAKVKTDRKYEMPKAIRELDASEMTKILDSYKGSPRIQAEFIAKFLEYRPQLVQIHMKTWEQILDTVAISPPETPNSRDMVLIACDILMSTDKHDLDTNHNYRTVMLLLKETVDTKMRQHRDQPSSVELSNKIIDVTCRVLLQMYTGDMRKPPPNSASSEFMMGSSGEYIAFAAAEILNDILAKFYYSCTDGWPQEDKLKSHDSVRTRFPKIIASLRWMMRTRNTEPSQIISSLLNTYLVCAGVLLEFFSVPNDGNSIRDSLELQVDSLEDMALENIRTCQYDSTTVNPSLSGESRGRTIIRRNIGYAKEIYGFRSGHDLGAFESAIKLVPVVMEDFVGTYGTPSHDGTLEVTENVIKEAFPTTKWVIEMLRDHATCSEVYKLRTVVNNACILPKGQICFLDIISGAACKSNTENPHADACQDGLFKFFLWFVSVLCVPQCHSHPHTIRVLETSKLSYKMLLISVHYFATHLLKAYSVESDLKIILGGLQVVLQMITYNPNRIIEQTLCKTTIFRSDEYMMNKFRGQLQCYMTAEERRTTIKIILEHYRGQADGIVLKYMEDFPTVCHTNIPDTYVPIQHTLSYINLTTLLAKIDSLTTTTPEIQAMSRELNRHLESFLTSIPLSSYTGP